MNYKMKRTSLILPAMLWLSLFSFDGFVRAQTAAPVKAPAAVKAEKFFQTELYFGRSKPDGSIVTDDEWKSFLAEVVTPKFPDGFTNLSGRGQYRDKNGKIVSEPSEVLIVLYPSRSKNISRSKIEEIRAAYVKRFDQESVLRVDLPKTVRVSF